MNSTNLLNGKQFAQPAIASHFSPALAAKLPPAVIHEGLVQAAWAFSHTYIVAVVLIVITLIPAYFLPRVKPVAPAEDASVMLGH